MDLHLVFIGGFIYYFIKINYFFILVNFPKIKNWYYYFLNIYDFTTTNFKIGVTKIFGAIFVNNLIKFFGIF